jgi:hypothetical protein
MNKGNIVRPITVTVSIINARQFWRLDGDSDLGLCRFSRRR